MAAPEHVPSFEGNMLKEAVDGVGLQTCTS
jgi:hypothetical protein